MNKIRQLDMRAAKVGAFNSTGSSSTGSAIPSIVGGNISGLNVDSSSLGKDGELDDKKGMFLSTIWECFLQLHQTILIICFIIILVGSSWSSAPTLLERQRENLTQRLRREFGLFVADEEESEKARKQGNLE